MYIQKIELEKPIKEYSPKTKFEANSQTKTKSKLTHSSSSCNLSSNVDYTVLNSLPYILSNDTILKKNSIKLSHLSLFDMRNFNNIQKVKSTDNFAGYKPKRLIKIKKSINRDNAYDFRYLPLNESKVFKTIEKNKDTHIFDRNLINIS